MKPVLTALTPALLTELATVTSGPCLSLYLPTHRRHPENQQDPIRFRGLLKLLSDSLQQTHAATDTQRLLAPFTALASDIEFWNHTEDGLAVFVSAGLIRMVQLPQAVPELAIVADSFHTKPLRRFLQTVGRFQVLALSLNSIRLYEGNRHGLHEVALADGVPRTLRDALGDELTEPHLTVSSYGGISGGRGNGGMPMHHGQGGKQDEKDIDSERFFRAVDRAIHQHHSQPAGLPLILAALPEHHHLFHEVSHNPLLLKQGVMVNPVGLDSTELAALAWQIVEPQHLARLAAWTDAFAAARAKGLGSDALWEVAQAAVEGRVATLLIEADRQVGGRVDAVTGQVDIAEISSPDVDDVLDDLGELVIRRGGVVHVLPATSMPGRSGLAATYRH